MSEDQDPVKKDWTVTPPSETYVPLIVPSGSWAHLFYRGLRVGAIHADHVDTLLTALNNRDATLATLRQVTAERDALIDAAKALVQNCRNAIDQLGDCAELRWKFWDTFMRDLLEIQKKG